jgi:hypothetical protein
MGGGGNNAAGANERALSESGAGCAADRDAGYSEYSAGSKRTALSRTPGAAGGSTGAASLVGPGRSCAVACGTACDALWLDGVL